VALMLKSITFANGGAWSGRGGAHLLANRFVIRIYLPFGDQALPLHRPQSHRRVPGRVGSLLPIRPVRTARYTYEHNLISTILDKGAGDLDPIIGYHPEVELPARTHGLASFRYGAERVDETMVSCHERDQTFQIVRVDRGNELISDLK